jgi:predicted RNA-binding protein with EMAP domain
MDEQKTVPPWALRHSVQASSVADFLERYYQPGRYRGRGEQYAAGLLGSYEREFTELGYCYVSYHDSATGRSVTYVGEKLA